MGIGVSIFLITLGAILKFAITAHLNGVNISMIGVILMVMGVLTLILNLVLFSRRTRPGAMPPPEKERIFNEGPPRV